ncbi:hypothetical protein ACMFMG_007348 [Clarireedia jacksonii]
MDMRMQKAVSSSVLPSFDIVRLYYGGDRLCSTCSKLDIEKLFRQSELNPEIAKAPAPFVLNDFWTTSLYCPFCRVLRQALDLGSRADRYSQSGGPRWVCKVKALQRVRYILHWSPGHHVTYELSPCLLTEEAVRDGKADGVNLFGRRVQLMANGDETREDQLALGRYFNPQRVDVDLLRSWIAGCDAHHKTICTPETWKRESETTLRMIDVKLRCVVEAPLECQYIVLSYCWGKPSEANKHLGLTEDTASWLFTEGSLSKMENNIPRTIQDAIDLVADLGERFLWVDALCIKQDDTSDKAKQIPLMGNIYASALCTIVAGSGSDAWAGLNGVGKKPIPRSPKSYQAKVHDHRLTTTQKHYQLWKNQTVWLSRGWTFQEKILSRRLMIFTDSQVYFQCKKALWSEDTIFENFNSRVTTIGSASDDTDLEIDSLLSVFNSYQAMVRDYSRRSFGYQSDALNSFQGVQQYLQNRGPYSEQRRLTGEFYFGLPESFFDAAMVWTLPYHYPDQRREMFPSWTWVGWNMEPGDNFRRQAIEFPNRPKNICPEVVWYRPVDDRATKYVKIDNCELMLQDSRLTEDEKKLRSQWKSDQVAIPLDVTETSHVLRFWTSTASLSVDRSGTQERRDNVHSSDPAILESEEMLIKDPIQNTTIGTISLSRSWRAAKPEELDFMVVARACKNDNGEKYGLYVMLIEWSGDIAYRVQRVKDPVREDVWASLRTRWKLISLA